MRLDDIINAVTSGVKELPVISIQLIIISHLYQGLEKALNRTPGFQQILQEELQRELNTNIFRANERTYFAYLLDSLFVSMYKASEKVLGRQQLWAEMQRACDEANRMAAIQRERDAAARSAENAPITRGEVIDFLALIIGGVVGHELGVALAGPLASAALNVAIPGMTPGPMGVLLAIGLIFAFDLWPSRLFSNEGEEISNNNNNPIVQNNNSHQEEQRNFPDLQWRGSLSKSIRMSIFGSTQQQVPNNNQNNALNSFSNFRLGRSTP